MKGGNKNMNDNIIITILEKEEQKRNQEAEQSQEF